MIAVSMCFSILQSPRCRIYTFANLWSGSFHGWTRRFSTCSKLHNSEIRGLNEGASSKKWTRKPITTKSEGNGKAAWSSKASSIRREVLEGTIASSTTLNINNDTEISHFQKIQHCGVERDNDANKELARLLTIIVFDIETTGFTRDKERIIEIALQDLHGGVNSTFQTLVNPERRILNSHVHNITDDMVNRPEVPRMVDLIPILLQYVKSRQKPGGQVMLVAHSGRNFDVPFLISEFSRYSVDIPSDWIFLDSLKLAREMANSGGVNISKCNVESLRQNFRIPIIGSPHRAMPDVYCLSLILQKITYIMKFSLSDLVERSFTVSDVITPNKKKKKSTG